MSAMSADQAGYYLGLAREDYYLEGGEPPGRWFGQGAEGLGLTGQVEADHLYNLFAGLSPKGDRSLIQRQDHSAKGKAEHRPGWDLTFSAPKSVSVLWSQSNDQQRQRIQAIHAQAVEAALGYLQDESTWTRRGQGGNELERVGLIAATFEHSTSRALDPQLHTHALVMNLSLRNDGTTGTLSSLDLFLSKMAAGALYRVELANGLQNELGVCVHRERSWFEATGVSKNLIEDFSKRREAIEEWLRETGLSSAEASAVGAVQTRSAKKGATRAELFGQWAEDGERLGWSIEQAQRLYGAFSGHRDFEEVGPVIAQKALERLTWDEAHFSERDFVRYLAEESQGLGVGAAEVRAGAAFLLENSPDVVRLGEHRGQQRFTTKKMLQLEGELLDGARRLTEDDSHQLHAESVMEAFSRHGSLSEEQLKAVWHITVDGGALSVVSGMAGTGKTRMLEVAREAWEAEGYQVKGAALAARAAKELTSGADVVAATIARTLMDLERGRERLDEKTILVIDEAGMVATPDMRRLVLACERSGSKLVLIGDERQLQPIGPGAPFRELGDRHGRAELSDVRRQDEDWARQAVKDMADGHAHLALEAFAERGFLKVSGSRTEAMERLVSQWREDGTAPEDTLILAGTRREADTLNRMAQGERLRDGELGGASAEISGVRIYQNDRVMFTKNRLTLGIDNGSKGTVQSVSGDGERMAVRLDSGERVSFETHDLTNVTLGYASTTHKAQGATTQSAYVLGGGAMQGRELSYVQASRARLKTWIFATVAETGDDVATLAKEMSRSRQKDMAHSLIQAHEEPDLSL